MRVRTEIGIGRTSAETAAGVIDEDSGLVSRCKKGHTDSFETLVKRHQKRAMNIVYRILGNYEEACEVVQDVFVSAYKGLGTFRGHSKFSTWLYSIAVNHARNRLRQMKARERFEGASIDGTDCDDGSPGGNVPASQGPLPPEALEKKNIQEKVQDCINMLDGEYREVLILRDVQGFSYGEIGTMLDIPEGTVRSRIFRARAALLGHLKGHMGDL